MQKKIGHNASSRLTSILGARILSEANDLKRTINALAQEIEVEESKLHQIIKGECSIEDSKMVIEKMGRCYPVDCTDLLLDDNDCQNGAKLMRSLDSKESGRIFARKDKNGNRTNYYEYRDTAMSKASPFRPEWIKELRLVENSDPYSPEVAYNNGHALHQMTFFVGPVNFYWEVNKKRFGKEMNTGDSNYITPFWPHSFTTRDKNKEAFILAVTFGGDIRRAQKELYALGRKGVENYTLDLRQPKRGTAQLIQQHMNNENLTLEAMKEKLQHHSVDLESILKSNREASREELKVIADTLNVQVADLTAAKYNDEEEVVVKQKNESDAYFYPSAKDKKFKIYPLARSSKMPLMKGFNVTAFSSKVPTDQYFNSSLHSYIYNYGEFPVEVRWIHHDDHTDEILEPGDSMVLQPFIPHTFLTRNSYSGSLCVMRVSGAVNLSTQRELSYFASTDRIIETTCWFD